MPSYYLKPQRIIVNWTHRSKLWQWNSNQNARSFFQQNLLKTSAECRPFCSGLSVLTHWGRVTNICTSKLAIIGSDNDLSPGRRQAIIWTNAGILLIGTLGTNLSEILIEIHRFSFKKMLLKMSSGKWRPFCSGLNVLNVASCLHADDIPWDLFSISRKLYGEAMAWCGFSRLRLCNVELLLVDLVKLEALSTIILCMCPANERWHYKCKVISHWLGTYTK